jgi:hypothetical protein
MKTVKPLCSVWLKVMPLTLNRLLRIGGGLGRS